MDKILVREWENLCCGMGKMFNPQTELENPQSFVIISRPSNRSDSPRVTANVHTPVYPPNEPRKPTEVSSNFSEAIFLISFLTQHPGAFLANRV